MILKLRKGKRHIFNSFLQQIFTNPLLCTRYSYRCWDTIVTKTEMAYTTIQFGKHCQFVKKFSTNFHDSSLQKRFYIINILTSKLNILFCNLFLLLYFPYLIRTKKLNLFSNYVFDIRITYEPNSFFSQNICTYLKNMGKLNKSAVLLKIDAQFSGR